MDLLAILRIVGALALVAWLPGRVWSSILLPSLQGAIERFVASVGLSIAMMVLALYLGYVLGDAPVSGRTAVAWSLALAAIGWGILLGPRLAQRIVVAR